MSYLREKILKIAASYNPKIITPGGKAYSLKEDPEGFIGATAEDLKRYHSKGLGIFGRERRRQERLLRTGELLGTLPPGVSQEIYQRVYPFKLD